MTVPSLAQQIKPAEQSIYTRFACGAADRLRPEPMGNVLLYGFWRRRCGQMHVVGRVLLYVQTKSCKAIRAINAHS